MHMRTSYIHRGPPCIMSRQHLVQLLAGSFFQPHCALPLPNLNPGTADRGGYNMHTYILAIF